MRGSTMSSVLERLKAEIGASQTLGINVDFNYRRILARCQEQLYDDYEWPFMKARFDSASTLNSGDFKVPFSTWNVHPEKITKVEVKYNEQWYPVEYGITTEDINQYDPGDSTQVADPIRKWDFSSTAGYMDIWPTVATSGTQKMRVWGARKLAAFAADNDVCDLDDQLIILMAAAELLKRANLPDWEDKEQKFRSRYASIRAELLKTPYVVMGGGVQPRAGGIKDVRVNRI